MSLQHIVGLAVGMLIVGISIVGVVVLLKGWRKSRERRKEERNVDFDERQELVRGKGFQYGFLILLSYEFLLSFVCRDGIPEWFDLCAVQMIGMGASLLVFCAYCIWNEAYIGLRENPLTNYLFLGGIGAMNLFQAVVDGRNGKLFADGRMTGRVGNLVLGIMFFLEFLLLLLRNIINRRRTE